MGNIFLSFLPLLFLGGFVEAKEEVATFAGGCFWCMQEAFDGMKGKGVSKTVVGYTGGFFENPTYQDVTSGKTGHLEAIEVYYTPSKISYEKLLQIFWHNIDPTMKEGQFCNVGSSYRSAIFYHNEEQKRLAEASREALKSKFSVIYTEVLPAKTFYPAEESHQDYYKKNPLRYKLYKYSCGREKRLKQLWN